jgi:hypothetical protein
MCRQVSHLTCFRGQICHVDIPRLCYSGIHKRLSLIESPLLFNFSSFFLSGCHGGRRGHDYTDCSHIIIHQAATAIWLARTPKLYIDVTNRSHKTMLQIYPQLRCHFSCMVPLRLWCAGARSAKPGHAIADTLVDALGHLLEW